MSSRTRALVTIVATLTLIVGAGAAAADDPPKVQEQFLIEVPPGQRLVVTPSFSAGFENEIIVTVHQNGHVAARMSNFGERGVWRSPPNTTDAVLVYRITSRHRAARSSWIANQGTRRRVKKPDGSFVERCAFEDSTDGDYDDAVAELRFEPAVPGSR